ncbi:hypothetical protein [Rubritalea tangerina]|uniref:hypothetical protein n=1 Tax=Rubritalea tangerina TaxID=430798 RepID=UPI0036149DBA
MSLVHINELGHPLPRILGKLKDTESHIEQVAEDYGFTYTPESLFGAPFDIRERITGDLFNQLYDYV